MNNSVVLVVDKYSLEVHLATRTAGVKYPVRYDKDERKIYYTKEFYSILADLANVMQGTSVFFYKRRIDEPPEHRGFLGEWEAVALPKSNIIVYEDLQSHLTWANHKILARCPDCGSPKSILDNGVPKCESCGGDLGGAHILPLRFAIQPARLYTRYLDDNTAYIDLTDHGRLSTLIFRKIYGAGRERSVNPILPEEADKLRRLLGRVQQNNQNAPVPASDSSPFSPTQNIKCISSFINLSAKYDLHSKENFSDFLFNSHGELYYETILEYWIMRQLSNSTSNFVHSTLEIPSDEMIEWFGNQVLFGIGGEKSDILVLTKNQDEKRCRAVVIELKKGNVDSGACEQIKRYSYWIAQLISANAQVANPLRITPIVIGYRPTRNIDVFSSYRFEIPYAQPLTVLVEKPRIFRYKLSNNNLEIQRAT
jgi:hypothetical protein